MVSTQLTEAGCAAGRQTITSAMADSWCRAAKQNASQGAMRQVLRVSSSLLHPSRSPGLAKLLATTPPHWYSTAASCRTAPTGHHVCTQAALADSSQLHLPCLKDAAEQGGSNSALQPGLGPTRPGGLTGLASCCRHLSRPLPQAFRVACHFGDSEREVHDSLRISSSAVFNGVLMFALKEVSPPA